MGKSNLFWKLELILLSMLNYERRMSPSPVDPISPCTPDPQRFVEAKGRAIEGLPVVPEKFVKLRFGQDYRMEELNDRIVPHVWPSDYLLFASPSLGTEERDVRAPHWRTVSTDIGDSVIRLRGADKDAPTAAVFFEVNTKGCGFLKPVVEGISLDDYDSWIAERDTDIKVLGMAVLDGATDVNCNADAVSWYADGS